MKLYFESEEDLRRYIAENVLITREAYEYLGITKQALSQQCKSGRIQQFKDQLFFKADLDAYQETTIQRRPRKSSLST